MAEVILSAKVPIYVHVSVDPDRDQTDITKVVVGDEELPSDSGEFDVVEVSGDSEDEQHHLDAAALVERARDAVGDADIMWPGWRFGY